MSRDRNRIDPAKIREALAAVDATTYRQASIDTGFNVSTLVRWAKQRRDSGGTWPSDEYIAAWQADNAVNGERRRIRAEKNAEYRKRVYLNRGNILTPTIGTTRRLQALYALGWTQRDMADRLGVSISRVHHILTARRPKVLPSTVAAVCALYEEWSMVVPADTAVRRKGQTKHHARARNRARMLGYLPPLAWDDIDDPHEIPAGAYSERRASDDVDPVVVQWLLNGERLKSTAAEKAEALRRWREMGRPVAELERALGIKAERYSGRAA